MSQNITPQDFLAYIVEQFNIKSGSKITAMDIKHEMSLLPNPIDFVYYAKQNMDDAKYDFKNGLQKFNAMIKDFKEEIKKSVCSDTEDKAKELVNKCRVAIHNLHDKAPKGFSLYDYSQKASYATFPNYFTKQEIQILDAVGGCKRWMNEYDESLFLENIISIINQNRINHYCGNLIAKKPNTDALALGNLKNEISKRASA